MLLQNYPSDAKFLTRSQGQNARNLISNVLTFPLSGDDSTKFQANFFYTIEVLFGLVFVTLALVVEVVALLLVFDIIIILILQNIMQE